MATFGRPELLNEAVESFLRQDYTGSKKLYILNDLPGSEYQFEHDEVFVENTNFRFASLGEKFNYLIENMECDIVVNWSDDDIRLPWAISTIVCGLGNSDVFAGSGYWYMNSGTLNAYVQRHCAGVLAYRYGVWSEVNGYAAMNSGEDQELFSRIISRHPQSMINLNPREAYFIYRWNTGFGQLSAHQNPNLGYARHGIAAKQRIGDGHIHIAPHWEHDYVNLVQEFDAQRNPSATTHY